MCTCSYESYENGTCGCLGVDRIGSIEQNPVPDIIFFTSFIVLIIVMIRLAKRGVFRDSLSTKKLVKKDVYDEDLDGV